MQPFDLEFFVGDSFFLAPEQEQALVELLEPWRDAIELEILEFEDDCPCWKIFREELWQRYVLEQPALQARFEAILAS
ncbi:MAG: hypothetical protein GWN58_26255 [Anaerolineae bacterium]|nr:hypothetical protein [Anaerolineae bacterium]